ncbi:hypothetical protein H8R18_08705 [Nanchangia anserum]|nr:lipid II flippase MurJ [Nanchangia anserum]QOX81775.1 hypothetical protein H8R18_08705 [Nanchangia anserum]
MPRQPRHALAKGQPRPPLVLVPLPDVDSTGTLPVQPVVTQRPAIKQVNVARASGIMAAGTMVSRVLGFIRTALLIALIGEIGANDAFNVANNLPNTIYNLLASSVLSAILVPQIVRALHRGNDEDFINRLLTLFTVALAGLTVLCTVAAPAFVYLYAARMDAQWISLAIVFAFWSLPQIFFYGLYSLWGQLLNAKGSFGPYMWAPVVNNVCAIVGLAVFWKTLGTSKDWASDPSVWTAGPIALLAGSSTASIVIQALILLIPLYRTGFRLRFVWGVRGHGLREVSQVAAWAFASLIVAQVSFLFVTNIAGAANGYATSTGTVVATITAHNTAFQVFMIPQSTIVTSVTTALFTSMSALVAANKIREVHDQFLRTQASLAVVTGFCAAALVSGAIPVMQIIMPSSDRANIAIFALLLALFGLATPLFGIWGLAQRLLLAFGDARSLFYLQLPMLLTQAVFVVVAWVAMDPAWWVPMASLGEGLVYATGLVGALIILQRRLAEPVVWPVIAALWQTTLASVIAGCAGWGVLHLVGPYAPEGAGVAGTMIGALWRIVACGIVMAIIYLGILAVLGNSGLANLAGPLRARLRR